MFKEHVFDNNHTGSYLTWKYFFPKKKVPNLILYVQDNDLWKFRIKKSKEVMFAVNLHPYSFDVWNKISRQLETAIGKKHYAIQGNAILKYVDVLAEEMAKMADEVVLGGVKALAVNAPRFIRSELGNVLIKHGADVGIVWYMKGEGEIHASLRSNGKVNVAKLAEKYGGGGHEKAAAFIFNSSLYKKFPWKLVK
jgi:oligoribonuclease NrnB/cAMP/cGMP phosphodiesterase (DHH superfamily)